MAWQANGAYYTFNEEMIGLHAPSVSGVYGLYNLRHQILIGNSENIRNALLRHLQNSRFRFRRFAPTGFVFELCPPEMRTSRAQELIREYKPILQTGHPLAALWQSWRRPRAMAFYPRGATIHSPALDGATKATPKTHPNLKVARFDREQFALVAAGFGAILLAAGLIAWFLSLKDDFNVSWPTASIGEKLPSNASEIQVASLTSAQAASVRDGSAEAANIMVPPDEPVTAPQPTSAAKQAELSSELPNRDATADGNKAAFSASQPGTDKITGKERERNGWTVQAVATPSKAIAADWLEKLKGKNYRAFVVKAEIHGQTWYRVRVGQLQTKAEAEALRSTLQSQEGFRDAFIAASAKSETLAALDLK